VDGSELFANLEHQEHDDFARAMERAQEVRHTTLDWWAISLMAALGGVREALKRGDMPRAVWEMSWAANARAMLIFRQSLERIAWPGYQVEQLRDVLRAWEANKDNDDEGSGKRF
jgi:hypothetical protein